MRILNVLLVLFAVSPLMAADVFKWVDADGGVHYGEDPNKGKVMELPGLTTYSSPPISGTSYGAAPEADTPSVAAVGGYTSAVVRSPLKGETIISNSGVVSVVVDTSPNLQAGDSIKVYLDGRVHGGSRLENAFELNGISGGAHQLRAVVFDSKDVVKIRTATVSFNLRNFSLGQPETVPAHQVVDDVKR